MEQQEAERDRISRMRQNVREAVLRRAQELSPTRKLAHSLSVPPASTTQPPPITAAASKPQRSSSTSRINARGRLDLPPCERRSSQAKAPDAGGSVQSSPKGYHKFTERLQAYMRSQSLKQPLELISNGAVTKEDRKQRYVHLFGDFTTCITGTTSSTIAFVHHVGCIEELIQRHTSTSRLVAACSDEGSSVFAAKSNGELVLSVGSQAPE